MSRMILPGDADMRGYAFGGNILAWMDVCAGTSANRFAGLPCVTASVDAVHFVSPIRVGDTAILTAMVNRSWKSSMEVGVHVEAEDMLSGERRVCSYAKMTFVAMRNQKPAPVPELVPQSPVEKSRWLLAELSRQKRYEMQSVPLLLRKDIRLRWHLVIPIRALSFEWVFTEHVNPLDITFGGNIMRWMHFAASVTASRHARAHLLLASIDRLQFVNPVMVGEVVAIRTIVSQAFNSSMELYITVNARDHCGGSARLSNEAFMTFVAVNERGRAIRVPGMHFESADERICADAADQRRARRLEERRLLKDMLV
ncbi:HotDog domain-containing protein [Thamnocephalis sphaerospora]|uniref:HotDog domain-containing protein n=1 Tax=Thamnocephalis sphaerospora TaxID=78915 RepID=A0A4P9XN88_9FUNG|nr:HotDog domain-containing protein [Thamnocephalis sphaerospora]|eukprot:RKP07375.1 HotDog domain-containing protein [Thamnocephalis sphaerospora]